VGLAAHSNAALLTQQAAEFGVRHVAAAAPRDPAELSGFTAFTGEHAARDLIHAIARPGDLVLAAMVGAAGIAPTLAAIDAGCDIALANKETLVAAGELVMARVRERGVALLPVDPDASAERRGMESDCHPLPETLPAPRALAAREHGRRLRATVGVAALEPRGVPLVNRGFGRAGGRTARPGLHHLSRLRARLLLRIPRGQ
jgi:hypothetical protein